MKGGSPFSRPKQTNIPQDLLMRGRERLRERSSKGGLPEHILGFRKVEAGLVGVADIKEAAYHGRAGHRIKMGKGRQ